MVDKEYNVVLRCYAWCETPNKKDLRPIAILQMDV
jgi:hypothetical protein